MMRSRHQFLLFGGVVISLSLLGALFVFRGINNESFIFNGPFSYITVAVIGVVTNASIILPAPTMIPVIVDIADQNYLPLVAFVYAVFAALGESTGYFLGGWLNQFDVVKKSRVHGFLESRMKGKKTTGLFLFFLAVMPLPFFDFGGMIAGNTRYPLRWFWLVTFSGRWIKYWFLTIPGWEIIEGLVARVPFLQSAAEWLMVAVIAIVGVAVLLRRLMNGKKHTVRAES